MKLEIVTPEEYMGDIIGDLNRRRGEVAGMEDKGGAKVINCKSATFRAIWICNCITYTYLLVEQLPQWNLAIIRKFQEVLQKKYWKM